MRGGTCWQPKVHGFTQMVNSSYNGYRFEDLWIEE
jgi:peptide/nickel transport system substrate-binding protein